MVNKIFKWPIMHYIALYVRVHFGRLPIISCVARLETPPKKKDAARWGRGGDLIKFYSWRVITLLMYINRAKGATPKVRYAIFDDGLHNLGWKCNSMSRKHGITFGRYISIVPLVIILHVHDRLTST